MKRKRDRQASPEPDESEGASDVEHYLEGVVSPKTTIPAKKRHKLSKDARPRPKAPKRKQAKPPKTSAAEKIFVSTQNPKLEPLIHSINIFQGRGKRKYFKASDDIAFPRSRIVPGQGQVKSYNLTQLNWSFIKSIVERLRHVARLTTSERKWKETVLHTLGSASVPDEKPEKKLLEAMETIKKERKRGQVDDEESEAKLDQLEQKLEDFQSGWYCEPFYNIDVVRGMFEDPNITFTKLTSTHGEFYIRTEEDDEHWISFVHWLEVTKNNLMGYHDRRNHTQWNGYEITECDIEDEPDLAEEAKEIDNIFCKSACTAVWRTIVYEG